MTFHPEALRLNLGAAAYARFRELKRQFDPKHLLTRGILPASGDGARPENLLAAEACEVHR
jgi:hypothetical protein